MSCDAVFLLAKFALHDRRSAEEIILSQTPTPPKCINAAKMYLFNLWRHPIFDSSEQAGAKKG